MVPLHVAVVTVHVDAAAAIHRPVAVAALVVGGAQETTHARQHAARTLRTRRPALTVLHAPPALEHQRTVPAGGVQEKHERQAERRRLLMSGADQTGGVHLAAQGHVKKVAAGSHRGTQVHQPVAGHARVDHAAIHRVTGVELHRRHVRLQDAPQPRGPGPTLERVRLRTVAVEHQHHVARVAAAAEAQRGAAGGLETGGRQREPLIVFEQARPGYRQIPEGYHVHRTPGGRNKKSAV